MSNFTAFGLEPVQKINLLKKYKLSLILFQSVRDEEGFIDFLPHGNGIKPLSAKDTDLVTSFLKQRSVLPVVNVQFDVNDRGIIVDGLFKGMEGFISDVKQLGERI